MGIKVISFDIFQTLVDVNQRIPHIWSRILGHEFTMERANEGAYAVVSELPTVMAKACCSRQHFYTMREVYEECVANAVSHLSFHADQDKVVDCLLKEHAKAPYFEEVQSVIKQLKKKYQVILCSDSSHVMVDGIIEKIRPSFAFISDDLKAYKADQDGKFFSKVLSTMNVPANEILHVGDSSYDIIGAAFAGIPGVLLCRDKKPVQNNIQPYAIIKNLNELFGLLGEGTNYGE